MISDNWFMKPSYRGHRFPPEIISHAVWLYHRFTLSFRDVEDLLAERGVIVSYEANGVRLADALELARKDILEVKSRPVQS